MATENEEVNPFGPVIFSYTRAQAIDDGVLFDVSETAREAGIKFPTVISAGVHGEIVLTPENAAAAGESDSGRLWDVLWMLRHAIGAMPRHNEPQDVVHFEVIATDQHDHKVTHKLYAKCHGGDSGEPVITVMLPGED